MSWIRYRIAGFWLARAQRLSLRSVQLAEASEAALERYRAYSNFLNKPKVPYGS